MYTSSGSVELREMEPKEDEKWLKYDFGKEMNLREDNLDPGGEFVLST